MVLVQVHVSPRLQLVPDSTLAREREGGRGGGREGERERKGGGGGAKEKNESNI